MGQKHSKKAQNKATGTPPPVMEAKKKSANTRMEASSSAPDIVSNKTSPDGKSAQHSSGLPAGVSIAGEEQARKDIAQLESKYLKGLPDVPSRNRNDPNYSKSKATSMMVQKSPEPGSAIDEQKLDEAIDAVALAVAYHIKAGMYCEQKTKIDVLDERLHPFLKPEHGSGKAADRMLKALIHSNADMAAGPTQISAWLHFLFKGGQLKAEVAVIVLAYLERIISVTGLTVMQDNWRRALLVCVLLAAKCWEDEAVWNVDFQDFLPCMNVKDINNLEMTALELMQYNVNVPGSLYAKYWFDLRTLAQQQQRRFSLKPLNQESADRLQKNTEYAGKKLRAEIEHITKSASDSNLVSQPQRRKEKFKSYLTPLAE